MGEIAEFIEDFTPPFNILTGSATPRTSELNFLEMVGRRATFWGAGLSILFDKRNKVVELLSITATRRSDSR